MTGEPHGASQLADLPRGQATWWYGNGDANESAVGGIGSSMRRRLR